MSDSLCRLLERLPRAEPDGGRAAVVRARCHRALQQQSRVAAPSRPADRLRVSGQPVAPAAMAAFVAARIRQALRVYGIL